MAFVAPLFTAISGTVGAAGGGLGSFLSAGAGILSTIGAVGQANYQAQVARNNAEIAKKNAELASDQSQQQQVQSDQETAALIGSQEAIQGASGLSISGATQLRTRRSAARLGRQDAINIREQGASEIQNLLQQSENFKGEARSQRAAAAGALLGGIFDVGSSLVGGATSVKNPKRVTGVAQVRLRNDLRRARV